MPSMNDLLERLREIKKKKKKKLHLLKLFSQMFFVLRDYINLWYTLQVIDQDS